MLGSKTCVGKLLSCKVLNLCVYFDILLSFNQSQSYQFNRKLFFYSSAIPQLRLLQNMLFFKFILHHLSQRSTLSQERVLWCSFCMIINHLYIYRRSQFMKQYKLIIFEELSFWGYLIIYLNMFNCYIL